MAAKFLKQSLLLLFPMCLMISAAENSTDKMDLSQCLTDPPQGLLYRYTASLRSTPEVKTGCYVMYGSGKPHDDYPYQSDPVGLRQYFLIDVYGVENIMSPDGYFKGSLRSLSSNETQTMTLRSDQLCFPEMCYDTSDDFYRNCLAPLSVCGRESSNKIHLGYVDDRGSEVFCTSGRLGDMKPTLFHPFEGAEVIYPGEAPASSGPYMRYAYAATSVAGVGSGCAIIRPLRSNAGYRRFDGYYRGNEVDLTSNVAGKKQGDVVIPPGIPADQICFPASCYQQDESRYCISNGRVPLRSAFGIIWHSETGQDTRLAGKSRYD